MPPLPVPLFRATFTPVHTASCKDMCTHCTLLPPDWYVALAAPSGSVANFPKPEDLRVFRIPYGSFIKLEVGTWHAGKGTHVAVVHDYCRRRHGVGHGADQSVRVANG